MSARQLLGIFGVLAALVAAWLLLARDGDGSAGDAEAGGGTEVASLFARADGVSSFRIFRAGGDTLRLERRPDGWSVNGYPANDSLVEATLEALGTLPPLRLIARNPASHARMGLAADSATRVRFDGVQGGTAEILVGGAGRGGRFVRLPHADPVYVGPSDALDALVGDEADWRDFYIARVDTATLRRVIVRRGGQLATTAEREVALEAPAGEGAPPIVRAGPWTVGGTAADTAVMRLYVGVLADLVATGFPADTFVSSADFERPAATVELYGASGAGVSPDLTLLFSTGLDHPDVLVRRGDSPIVYAIDRARANLLTTTRERLLGLR